MLEHIERGMFKPSTSSFSMMLQISQGNAQQHYCQAVMTVCLWNMLQELTVQSTESCTEWQQIGSKDAAGLI